MPSLDLTQVLVMPWAVPVIMGCLVGMVAIVSGITAGCISGLAETKLKRSMVERGFSAGEIERVIRASAENPPSSKPVPAGKGYVSPAS